MLLHSIEIKNYRSLEHIKLDSFQQFNVLIGRNNAGKSAIFQALEDLNKALYHGQRIPQEALTGRDAKRSFEINLVFELRSKEREEFIHMFVPSLSEERRTKVLESNFLRQMRFAFKTVSADSSLLHLPETQLLDEDGNWLTIQRIKGNNITTEADYQFVQIGIAAQKGS